MAMAECVLPRRVNGLASRDQAREVREYRFRDHRTGPIVKRVFFCLLSECNTENEVLSTFTVDLDRLSEADAKVVREASDKAVKLLHREPKAGVRYNVKDFTEEKWDIHSGNMYSEFRKIVQETLKQEANSYGRLVAFLGFAVSYGVYVRGRGIHQALPSVEAWTVQVIEDDVGTFFRENGGWDGFISYCDVCLRAKKQNGHSEQPSFWQAATAVGALGIGALAALTLRNAFS